MHFEEHRLRHQRYGGANGGIEPLQMACLGDSLSLCGDSNQFVGFSQRSSDGLFDEHVHAGLHESARDLEMRRGRHGDRNCLRLGRLQHFFQRAVGFSFKLTSHGGGAGGVRVADAGKFYFAGGGKLVINAGMVAPKGAYARYGNTDFFFSRQSSVLGLQEKRL